MQVRIAFFRQMWDNSVEERGIKETKAYTGASYKRENVSFLSGVECFAEYCLL